MCGTSTTLCSTMVVKPFGATCEEVIGMGHGAKRKIFSKFSKVILLLGRLGGWSPGKILKMMLSDWLKMHLQASDKL